MLSRLSQFLVLVLLVIQSPTARACGVEKLLTGMNCHERTATDISQSLAHCNTATFGQALDGSDDRPDCGSCQIKPLATEQSERSSLPTFSPWLVAVTLPFLPDSVSTHTFSPSDSRSISATTPSVARVLPLLI